jgi:penicillin amidase
VRTIRQIIPVRGKPAEPLTIRLTHHGPVVETFESEDRLRGLAARWAVTEVVPPFRAAAQLLRSETIQDVVSALRHWSAPGQNFVFADTRGDIGYWCCTVIPIRPDRAGLLPVPGWTEAYEWQGTVPFEERPHLINPPWGFIASANNRVAGAEFPYYISTYWDAPDRFLRIRQLLAAKSALSVQDVRQAQADVYVPLASLLVPLLLETRKPGAEGDVMEVVYDLLAAWNCHMDKESTAAAVFEVTLNQLLRNLLAKELGPDLLEAYLELSIFPPRALRRLLVQRGSGAGYQQKSSDAVLSDELISASLRQAVATLRDRFGDDPTGWRWGQLHTLTFEHVLGKRRPLDLIFNIGPYPVGGSNLTVNKKQYGYAEPYAVKEGASQRMIVDLARTETTLHVLPTGQSGLKGSPHYKDQLPLYLDDEYRTFQMNRDAVERQKEGTLLLVPQR